MDLDKQGIFAQTATEEESCDVMTRFSHCLQNVKRAELNPGQKKGDDSGHERQTQRLGDRLRSREVTLGCVTSETVTHSQGLHGGQVEQSQVIQTLRQR